LLSTFFEVLAMFRSCVSAALACVIFAGPVRGQLVCAPPAGQQMMLVPAPAATYAAPQTPTYQAAPPPTQQMMLVPAPMTYAAPVTYAAPPAPVAAAPCQLVWGPTPLGRCLAAVGRKMATLDRRHVWTIQHSAYAQTPAATYSLIVPSTYTAAPPVQTYAVPQSPPVTYAAPPPPAKGTPQGTTPGPTSGPAVNPFLPLQKSEAAPRPPGI
jgi:hypothetical protein